jgi:hypothetical protein
MPEYSQDRAWSDKYIPHMKQIIGPHLLVESSFEVDTKRASDLVLMQAAALMIACRVRRPGYADRYPNQFTLRFRRDSGVDTEYSKVVNGWGDWMFYGHAHPTLAGRVDRWMLINLRHFRAQLINDSTRRTIKNGVTPNGDGTYFRWFDASSFARDPPLLVASSHQPNQEEWLAEYEEG